MHLPFPALFAAVLGTSLMGWTASNGTATPGTDSEASFPSFECVQKNNCTTADNQTHTHWLGRTPSGNLYLVTQSACTDANRCSSWFVERTARGMGATLNVEGRFQLVRDGQRVPDVQTWREVSDHEIVKTRYTWVSGTYRKAETRTVYRVDGVECGTASECNELATRAHQEHRTDKALRIWETVHKVSWI
ncbi:MAG TPA: hypothetical protein DIC36_04345 [Gammaproteobacteria bacterium]|nr:hypothetical protein [Gammaproteobacteria bacterium]